MHTTQHETLSEPLLLTIPQTAKKMSLGHTKMHALIANEVLPLALFGISAFRSYVQIVVVVLE
jgi:NAD dependent epimerase/dehydratase family enzyme